MLSRLRPTQLHKQRCPGDFSGAVLSLRLLPEAFRYLCVYHKTGGADIFLAGNGDMPFVKAGNAHGNAFPTEAHTAFHIGFTAHVECPGVGEAGLKGSDDGGFDSAADEDLRTIFRVPQFQELTNGIDALDAAAGCAAGPKNPCCAPLWIQ